MSENMKVTPASPSMGENDLDAIKKLKGAFDSIKQQLNRVIVGQDALLERHGRWPLCPVCGSGDPHALEVEPELGPDPHWVCHKAGVKVASVGSLGSATGSGPSS